LLKVAASGGPLSPVTELDAEHREGSHRYPQFLPDGEHFLFLAIGAAPGQDAVYVGRLGSADRKLLLKATEKAMFAPPNSLLFMRDSTLMTQRFDPDRLELSGDALRVADDVGTNLGNSLAGFSVSSSGILAFRSTDRHSTALTWVDRTAAVRGVLGDQAPYTDVELSPDGSRMAVSILDVTRRTSDIWIYDIARGESAHVKCLTR
jgi:hypothetical protein